MKIKLLIYVMLGFLPILPAHGDQHIPKAVLDSAVKIFPGFSDENISPSPMPGVYQLFFGSRIIYMSEDGEYVIRGDLIDVNQGVNITQVARNKLIASEVEALGEESMIIFSPEEVKSTITVFTDISCPYCSKLHDEVPNLNDNGVKVRYLAYPRAGIPSSSADNMASVWCAEDPKVALTNAKAGHSVEAKQCSNPVKDHYELGTEMQIGGTPTIVLEDGSILGGYVPHANLTAAALRAHEIAVQ